MDRMADGYDSASFHKPAGGQVGMRGYLVQTLIALLDVALAEQPFTKLILEPGHESEKFDLVWEDAAGCHAMQVKSRDGQFEKAEVEMWAAELEASGAAADYRLRLVGLYPARLAKTSRINGVVLENKNLDLRAFRAEAAHCLDKFLRREGLEAGSSEHREMLVDALTGRLAMLSTGGEPMTRDDLVRLLKRWTTEPTQKVFAVPYLRNPYFVGRMDCLSHLRHRFENRTGDAALVEVISGLGGMGKTQTAVHFCYEFRDSYDWVFWIYADTPGAIQAGLADMSRTLKLSAANGVTQEKAVRVTLDWLERSTRWLLVLDNVERAEWLRPFIPMRGQGHVLITSREQDFDLIGVARPLKLQRLSPHDSERFLLHRTGREEQPAEEQRAVASLVELLDYLPLAIEQAGAFIIANQTRFQDYLASYQQRRLQLLELTGPKSGDYPASVGTTWSLNFSQIESESRRSAELLKSTALLAPDAIPMELLAQIVARIERHCTSNPEKADLVRVDELLKPLRRYSLVEKSVVSSSVSVHRLVQEVLRSRMDQVERDQWAALLTVAINEAFPAPGFADWASCSRVFHQALSFVGAQQENGTAPFEMGQLLRKTAVFLHAKGESAAAEPLLSRAMGIYERAIEAALGKGDSDKTVVDSLAELADIQLKREDSEQAEENLQKALVLLDRSSPEQTLERAYLLTRLGIVCNAQRQYRRAKRLHKRALTIQRKLLGEYHPDVARTLNELAGLYYDMRKFSRAEALYRTALGICRKSGGGLEYLTGTTLNNLGLVLRTRSRYNEALTCYMEALDLFERTLGHGNPEVAMTLTNLAARYRDQDSIKEAVPYLQRAYEILQAALGSKHKDVIKVGQLLDAAQNRSRGQKSDLELSLPEIMERTVGRKKPAEFTPALALPAWKRTLDITCIFLAAPVLLPLGLTIAAFIKLASPGPLLFRQTRIGYKGNAFTCLKFRTISISADAGVHQRHLQDLIKSQSPLVKMDARSDPRIIPGGRFLRTAGLDELPQLLNVLRGEMSLVGPRPCVPYEYEQYAARDRMRCNSLPGLTGLWQVSGKYRTTFAEMIELDIRYREELSLWRDLAILLTTPVTILKDVFARYFGGPRNRY